MSDWVCESCEYENEAGDANCAACDEPRPATNNNNGDDDDRYKGIVVGEIMEMEAVAGKDKLSELKVNVGAAENLNIVTNAPNIKVGARVVVATVGAVINDVAVKKATVGGRPSHGMLCDAPMLGWTGGGAGAAALVPDTFAVGARPPEARPRMV